MIKHILLLGSALLSIYPLTAQDKTRYSLKECIEIGLERNYSLRIARNHEQIASNNATLGNAGYLPTLNLSGGYSGSVNDIQTEAHDGETSETNGVHNTNTNVGLNLNWTLFDGLYIQTNYKRLQELKRQGELQTRLSVESYIAQLAAEYYNYIREARMLKTLRYAVALSRERLRIVEARYLLGDISRLDLQQATVDFNADSSRMVKQQVAVKTSVYSMNLYMSVDDVYKPFAPTNEVIDINHTLELDALLEETLETNSRLLLAAKSRQLSELDLKAAKSRNYPYLKVNGGYGYTLNQYEVAANRSQQSLGFNYGATIGFTLFDGLNRSREQKNARIGIINAETQYQELEFSLRTDLANIYDAYRNNIALVTLEEHNLSVAQENYEIAMERYKIGTLAGIELREAQKSLLDAEERLLTSQYNTKVCEISLLQISGTITALLD